mgnify:CR=1 FL=1
MGYMHLRSHSTLLCLYSSLLQTIRCSLTQTVPVSAHAPLPVIDGTLTQTMKPRKQVIAKKYSTQVDTLMNQLRG